MSTDRIRLIEEVEAEKEAALSAGPSDAPDIGIKPTAPEEASVSPTPTSPSPSPPQSTSIVITAQDRLSADPDSASLLPLPDTVSSKPPLSAQEEVKVNNLPDPETFIGIPGPGSAPREGSIREKTQEYVTEKLVEFEEAVVGFELEMRSAGRELGAEAQEAYAEGDYLEAFAKGTAAFTTRAGVGIIDAATFPVRPLAIAKTAVALVEGGKEALEHPEDIPEGVHKWAENIAHDPGSIAEFAADIATGFAFGEVIKTVRGPTHRVSRLDAVDIDVKSSTLKLVDDADNIMGKPSKAIQFPEAEITPSLSTKKIPKIASEIIEAELDDISGSGRILGVADEGRITSLDKIEVTEGMIDDLALGKKVKVEGLVEVENVGLGYEPYHYVEDVVDPLTGESRLFAREKNILPIDAKEVGSTIDVLEDASPLKTLSLEGDELITTPSHDIQSTSINFKSIWDDEGVKTILEEGDHTYKVIGVEIDATPQIIDKVLDDIKPIEPTPGPKTPLAEHFQQPGYTAPLGEIPDALTKDIDIVRELTDEVKPVSKTAGFTEDIIKTSDDLLLEDITKGTHPIAKIIETPPKIPTELITGPSVARATRKGTGPPGIFDDLDRMPRLFDGPPKPDAERGKLPNPYFETQLKLKREEETKKKEEEETVPLVLEELKLGTTPRPKPKPRPTPPIVIQDPKPDPQPKPPPTIPIIIPILGAVPEPVPPPPIIIQEPKLDTPSKPPPQIQETVTKTTPQIPFPTYLGASRRKRPREPPKIPKKRRPRILQFTPPKIGYEDRKYRIRSPKEMMSGLSRSKSTPAMPQLPDSYNLSKPKKKRRKKK